MAEIDDLGERLRAGSRKLTIPDEVRARQLDVITDAVRAAAERPLATPTRPSALRATSAEAPRRTRLLAGAGVACGALVLAAGFSSLTSLPGDVLYPAKRVIEQGMATVDDDVHVRFRLDELEALMARSSPADSIVDAQRAAASALAGLDDAGLLDRYGSLAVGTPGDDGSTDRSYRYWVDLHPDRGGYHRISLPDGGLLDLSARTADDDAVRVIGDWRVERVDGDRWMVESPTMPTVWVRFDSRGAELSLASTGEAAVDERAMGELDADGPGQASGPGPTARSAGDDAGRNTFGDSTQPADAGQPDDTDDDGGGSATTATTMSPPTTLGTTVTTTTTTTSRPTTTTTKPATTTTRPATTTTTTTQPTTTTTEPSTTTTDDDDDDDDDD